MPNVVNQAAGAIYLRTDDVVIDPQRRRERNMQLAMRVRREEMFGHLPREGWTSGK